MKRFLAVLALVVGPVVGVAPAAYPLGEGACTITGTISFTPESTSRGTWKIGPAILDCQGVMAARWRITGRGPIRGTGTFTELPGGGGSCLHHAGTGKLDYTIPTAGGDIVISEQSGYTLAGAYPQVIVFVFVNGVYIIMGNGSGIVDLIPEHAKAVAVVAVQPEPASDPHSEHECNGE